jgi:hypothetical protein
MRRSIIVPLLVAVVVVGVLVLIVLTRGNLTITTKEAQEKPYHAVFLTNNQVYFGKIQKQSAELVVLEDIFYLQVNQQQIQPPPEGQDPQNVQLTLVKLGNELHGPKDEMKISRRQVLFTEELKESGQVVQTIKRFKGGETGGQATSSPSPAGSPKASATPSR